MKILLILLIIIVAFVTEIIAKIPNPYKVLGIPQDANQQQIKQAFKKRSKKYHPDRNKVDPRAKEKFEKIANAYQLLKDPERRRMYDLTGDQDPTAQHQQHHGFGGFPGGFGFGGGIDIQELMRQGFFGGHPGGHGHHGHHQQGGQRRQATYTFSFGGGEGMRVEF